MGRVIPLEDIRETGQKLQPLLDLVADDLEAINRIILDKAVSDVEMIPELAHHLIDSGGKRLQADAGARLQQNSADIWAMAISAPPLRSNSCTRRRFSTTMSSMRAQRGAAARLRA